MIASKEIENELIKMGWDVVGQWEYEMNGWILEYACSDEEPNKWRIDAYNLEKNDIMWFNIENEVELFFLMKIIGIKP